VKDALFDRFNAGFEKKGYAMLGFAEAGFVYFFSRHNIAGPDGLRRIKMWVWKDDPMAKTFLETFGITTHPLHVTEVNTGLETGMIDSFYSPALAAIVFQWYAKIRYVLDYPIVNSTGALLIKKSILERLSERNRSILKAQTKKYCRELTRVSRRENTEALAVIREAGIEFLAPTPGQIAFFKESARKTHEKNMPRLYAKPLFDQVQGILDRHRSSR